jgi:HPt (histidine-containing phosphotransfer) domain-containing protein
MELIGEQLKNIGVDVDSVVQRLGGNEALYLCICKKFIQDPNYQLFQSAIAASDLISARNYIHTLKGVAANLGFIRLEYLCSVLFENIKSDQAIILQHYMDTLSEEYDRIIAVLINA